MARKRRFNGISQLSGKYTRAQKYKHLPNNTIFQGCNYRDFVSSIRERKSPFIWIFQSRISICVSVSLSSLSGKLYNCIPASFVYRQADKRFWDSHGKGHGDVKARFDKLPTARPSGGKLSEKASLTLEQFVAELKKRIQEKTEKQKNDKLFANTPANERPKTIPKPIQRQQKILQRPKDIVKVKEDNAGSGAESKPSNSANIQLPPTKTAGTQKKKETQSENGVRNPVQDKGKDAKIVTSKPRTGSGKIKPSELPQINNKVPRLPNIKQFPRIPAR